MSKTNELLIAVFDGGGRAKEVLDELKARDDVSFTGHKNATAITRNAEGQMMVSTPVNTRVTAVFGAIIGGLLGTFIGAPVAGTLLGGAALSLWLKDTVVSLSYGDHEMERVKKLMTADTSAIITSIEPEQIDELVPILFGYGAEIIRHEFAKDVAEPWLPRTATRVTKKPNSCIVECLR